MSITVSGAYGRDYKNKQELLADWNADKDFQTRGLSSGYINKSDAERQNLNMITARYKQDRSVCVLKRKGEKWAA